MKTFDRYVLRLVFWPLLIALGITLFALLLERFVGLLDLFVNKGSPVSVVVRMMASLVPHYVGLALPAAFFIAVLLAIRRLSRDSELHALQSAGIGLPRLIVPIFGVAVVLTVLGALIFNYLQPYSRYAYRALNFSLTETAWNAALESGALFTGFPDKVVLIERVSGSGDELIGIFVHEVKTSGQTTTITAETGRILRSSGELGLTLRLINGRRLDAGAGSQSTKLVSFEQFDVPLERAFETKDFHRRGKDEEELTLGELWALKSTPPPGVTESQVVAEINSRIVRSLTILVLPFLAIPFGIATRRGGEGIGMAISLIFLLSYHHVLQLGHSLTGAGQVSPLVGLWLPFAVFAAFERLVLQERQPATRAHVPVGLGRHRW